MKKQYSTKQKWFRRVKVLVLIYCSVGIALFYLQEKILLHPKKLDSSYRFKFSGQFTELNIPFNATDTVNMVKFFPVDSVRKGVVLYFHGNKDNIEHYAPFVSSFTKHGYEVWMPDYPGFGKSSGEISEQKLYSLAYRVRQMATAKFGSDSTIIYGKSLGTALAAYIASEIPCKRLILETPYYSVPALFRSYAFMYPASMMSHYKLPTYEFLRNVIAPVAIFHGTGDWVVPYRCGVKLKTCLKASDIYITIPKGEHNNLAESTLYRQTLDSLLSH